MSDKDRTRDRAVALWARVRLAAVSWHDIGHEARAACIQLVEALDARHVQPMLDEPIDRYGEPVRTKRESERALAIALDEHRLRHCADDYVLESMIGHLLAELWRRERLDDAPESGQTGG